MGGRPEPTGAPSADYRRRIFKTRVGVEPGIVSAGIPASGKALLLSLLIGLCGRMPLRTRLLRARLLGLGFRGGRGKRRRDYRGRDDRIVTFGFCRRR